MINDQSLHTTPNITNLPKWMFSQKLFFISSLLQNDKRAWHSSTSPNQQRRPFAFSPPVFILLLWLTCCRQYYPPRCSGPHLLLFPPFFVCLFFLLFPAIFGPSSFFIISFYLVLANLFALVFLAILLP